ncbi:hypothetical protein GCK72_016396 [Caenorhabditis remanei]|uniref:DUF38 domain-containing protein n=1 Tax=Caenorhabditis remanei TaxID=31234 RepID=A0A6A5G535_CAERE|nr:hypothetical protein GCK72_016396 [Caenorhabditis remanei]KAF1749851.1 hypothetical protein GCK72_016396 [Caenorhabditis remanei]
MTFIALFAALPILISALHNHPLPEERRACTTQEITYIPDEYDVYEKQIELSLDSGMSLNRHPVTRILAEECGLRDKVFPTLSRRDKRSPIARGIFRLSKYFLHFFQKSKLFLKPELLKGIAKVVEKLNHVKTSIGKVKYAGIGNFFMKMWEDVEELRAEEKDAHMDVILEQTLRTSLQLLINHGIISDMLLHHPIILEEIKGLLLVDNEKLLSEVTATNVMCHQSHRDSQVVIYLKLKIPKVARITIEKCDDIGKMVDGTYQYYTLPKATFKKNGHIFKVDIEWCFFEHFTYCPTQAIRPTDCSKEKLQRCELRMEQKSDFDRELQNGFAVYGDFTQILTEKDSLQSRYLVKPRVLYHIVPKFDETLFIGGKELKQMTQSKETIIRPIKP